MFNSKQKNLFGDTKPTSASTMTVPEQPFLRAGIKKSVTTTALGNGATKLTSTGSEFVNQFGKITNYKKPRSYQEVNTDMTVLWSQNPLLTMCLLFYIRMITRIVQFFDGSKTENSQRGQGLKHEGIFRMMWVGVNYPDTFVKNIPLFINIGSWKDIITMLSYDLQYNGWKDRKLDWTFLGQVILTGLENPNTSELVKKYLPQIKSNSQCKTLESQADNMIAKWICSLLYGGKTQEDSYKNYRLYRKLKSSGTAHQWQQLISKKLFNQIDFNTIHGRALSQLVSGKFLKNQGLESKYQEWIESKPLAKFTGYVYELFTPLGTGTRQTVGSLQKYQVDTINKQFLNLVEVARNGMKDGDNGFIGVLDTSGSMTSLVSGTKVSAYSVGKGLTLFMSYLLKGRFNGCYLEFSRDTIMKQWKGNTPVEQLCAENSSIIADTNFISVADHFGKILQSGVPESDFPKGIVCFSDGCFNSTSTGKSNFNTILNRLSAYGFSKEYINNFQVILWDIPNNHYGGSQTAFESFADTPNLFHISGLDGSALAFLTGVNGQKALPTNSDELFLAAMDQECLRMIEL